MLDQIAIAATGVAAAWVNQDRNESVRRWGCILGLVGQPFWFYAAWKAEQWGVFSLSVAYTASFLRGVCIYWLGGRRG